MKNSKNLVFAAIALFVAATAVFPQAKTPVYSYNAQKAFIPPDLGKVNLGMPLREFVKQIDITNAVSQYPYSYLELDIPFSKGNITGLRVRVHGLTPEQLDEMHVEEKVKKKDSSGYDYEVSVKRPRVAGIPSDGVVYSMYVSFAPDFDLKNWAAKTYGKGEVRAQDDKHYFYDEQWMKRSGDGLGWMIRAFYKTGPGLLQLLGRVPGSEWDPEA